MEPSIDQALSTGIEAHKAGLLQEANKYYTEVLNKEPNHPDANHNMGILAVGIGKAKEALPFFMSALEANPSIAQFWLSLIDTLIKLERFSDAREVYNRAKENGAGGDVFDQYEKRLQNHETIKIAEENPQNVPQDQLQSIINLYNQGQFQQTLNEVKPLIQKFPNSVVLHNIYGAANADLGFLDAAVESYKQAIVIKPDFAEAYNNMGTALQEQGKLEEAAKSYETALLLKPDYAGAYTNLGSVLKNQNKLQDAEVAFEKAITIDPKIPQTYNNLGETLQKQGKLDKAIKAYGMALSINPRFAEALNNRGAALQELNRLDEAIDDYQKALSINPQYTDAKKNYLTIIKFYSPKNADESLLFKLNKRVKTAGETDFSKLNDIQLSSLLVSQIKGIQKAEPSLQTELSQIYKSNSIDLGCKRHMTIFNTQNIIPEFCFGCYKVQVEVSTVLDLIRLTQLFYSIEFESDLTRKCLIEMRPGIPGYYKGLIYCRQLEQAKDAKSLLDQQLKKLSSTLTSKIEEDALSSLKLFLNLVNLVQEKKTQ